MARNRYNSPAEYYERLGGLETRMDTVEGTLNAHGSKLDQIMAAVSGHTKFDPVRVMQFIALAVAIVGAAGTAITYVATSTNSDRIAVVEFQAQQMWKAGRWRPNVTVRAKGTHEAQ